MPERDESGVVPCGFKGLRGGRQCERYAAPSLWCDHCWPGLAKARGINTSLWPERQQVDVSIEAYAPPDPQAWSPFTDEDPY